MATIRAIAIHVAPRRWEPLEVLTQCIELATRLVDGAKDLGLEVWTWRIIFPPLPREVGFEDLKRMADSLDRELPKEFLIHVAAVEPDHPAVPKVLDLLENRPRIYACARCSNDAEALRIFDTLWNSRKEPDVYTRFAVAIGTWVETPYLPATASLSMVEGFSAALRYVDLVEEAILRGSGDKLLNYVKDVEQKLLELSKMCRVPFLGIDLSLSPWMNESVAGLVEKLIDAKFGSLGTINAIRALNMLVKAIAGKLKIKTIGFNEVMLPVAEDDVLNNRVKEGFVRLRDLVYLSMVCVVGLDMVAVPRDLVDRHRLAIDMLTIYNMKRTPVGVRVIPVDKSPGEEVELPRYGRTFVVHL